MAENRGVKYELAYANKKDKSHLSTAPKHFCQAKINPEIKKVLFLIKNWRSKEDKQADKSEFKILIRSKLVWKLKVLSFWQDLAQWTKKHVENENVDFVSGKKYNFPLNHISIFTPSTIFLQTRPAIYYFLSHKSRTCACATHNLARIRIGNIFMKSVCKYLLTEEIKISLQLWSESNVGHLPLMPHGYFVATTIIITSDTNDW